MAKRWSGGGDWDQSAGRLGKLIDKAVGPLDKGIIT
jgi:hypothetical protein